jgi:hypothetical protein
MKSVWLPYNVYFAIDCAPSQWERPNQPASIHEGNRRHTPPPGLLASFAESLDEVMPIGIIEEDLFAAARLAEAWAMGDDTWFPGARCAICDARGHPATHPPTHVPSTWK